MKRMKFVNEITPLQKLNFKIGNTFVFMKRDDLIGFGGGGNKVRLFEYIAADMTEKNVDKIITFGSIHSNHVRVAAVVASQLNIPCDLIILYDKKDGTWIRMPNLMLAQYCEKIHIQYCETGKAHDFIDEYISKYDKNGRNYYWIPGGGHLSIATCGYRDAGIEIIDQLAKLDIQVDAVFVPCGTGTTQAGLIRGFNKLVPVYGITIARDADRCRKEILNLLEQTDDEGIEDCFINVLSNPIRYAEANGAIRGIIKELVKSDGIFLDPVYNAKSFLAMTEFLKGHPKIENAVYINTGGYPNLFA